MLFEQNGMNLQLKPKQRTSKSNPKRIQNENKEKRSLDDDDDDADGKPSFGLWRSCLCMSERTSVWWDNGKVLYTTYAFNFVLHLVGIFVLTVCYAVAVVLERVQRHARSLWLRKVVAEFYITH